MVASDDKDTLPMQAPRISLSRRLTGRYLMFGLAGLFLCLVGCLALASRGVLISRAELSVVAPMLVLIVGTFMLRSTVGRSSEIESQLRCLVDGASFDETALRPVAPTEPAAVGWNRLVEHVCNQMTLANLESRLSHSLAGLKQHDLEQVLDSLSDGVAVTDAEGLIALANKSFFALTQVEEDELSGQSIETLLRLADAENADVILRKLKRRAGPVVFELRKSEEIESGVLRVSRSALSDAGMNGQHCVWTVRDITQQRLAEEMRNQFVFTATHELRTPLANIKAYAETLTAHEDIDLEQQKQFCNTINAEATRLSRFVDELLNISQMEAGSLSPAMGETDIERLLEEVIRDAKPQIEQKAIEFDVVIPAKLPKLLADKDKVAASLVNILGNAVKYTPEGGNIRFQVEADPLKILFHVEDSGIGISDDELPRIFDKFYRSSDRRVHEVAGSGLGLAFTHEVARLHGGSLSVHSELNKGSKFTLMLPVAGKG